MTLMCAGHKLFVGTSSGVVAIFDSETVNLLKCFSWHKNRVRTLLAMPKQVEPCICAEIPFPDKDNKGCKSRSSSDPHGVRNSASTILSLSANRKYEGVTKKEESLTESLSYSDNICFIPNPEPESIMVTSVGNGKVVHTQSMSSSTHSEDVMLLTWKS